jgi:hypothetical protein
VTAVEGSRRTAIPTLVTTALVAASTHLGRGGSRLARLEQGPRWLLGGGREGGVAAKLGHGGCSRGIGLRRHAAKGDEDGAGWRDRRAVL